MSDLPLIGGHAPGTSAKAFSETCVNLFIEARGKSGILRNRPGYERYDRYSISSSPPIDTAQAVNTISSVGAVATITNTGIASVRYGYEVGDSITIANATDGDWDKTWIITSVATDGLSFTIDNTEHSPTPVDEASDSPATVIMAAPTTYKKEIRLLQRYDAGSGVVVIRGVIGNRVYNWSHAGGAWIEETAAAHRFISMNGAVAGAQMGDLLADGVVLCDGISAIMEGVTSLTLTKTEGAWSSSALSVKSNTATFMDGFIIRDDKANTGRFIYSDLYDASTENPFNFATAEGSPDDLLAVLADRRELWMFGEWSTEIWFNAGGKDLPFQRFQGGFIEMGIAAPLTAQQFDNSIAWLAQDRRGGLTVVRAGEGFQPQMISTEQINVQLNKAAEYVFNAFAQVIRWEGHEFYCLTIPGNYGKETMGITDEPTPVTFVYDSNSKEWFKWKSHDDLMETVDHGRWFMTAHVHAYDSDAKAMAAGTSKSFRNGHMIGGRDGSGEIYLMTPDNHVDEHSGGSQVIECERTLPAIYGPENMRVNAGPIELVTDADAGENISVDLSYAKDGKSFGTTVTRAVTANSSRLMWKKVGRARHWIFKVAQNTTATLPVRWLRLLSKGVGQ